MNLMHIGGESKGGARQGTTVDREWKEGRQVPGFAASCYKAERGLDLKLSDQQGQQPQPQ